MSTNSRLELYLLGPFHASLHGEALTAFRTDTARGLLAYLAMHPGIVFRREVLAALLWSEHDQESALVNLRQILTILRRVLDDGEAEQPFLEITPRTLRFDPTRGASVDVNHFRQLSFRQLEGNGTSPDTSELGSALELYRGDMLSDLNIPSPAFDEWLVREREHLHQQAVDLVHGLACFYERENEPEKVKHYASKHIEMEPWSEEAYRQLMLAYATLGQRSTALKQYAMCQRALLVAFGVEPGEKTRALHRKIANDEL